MKKLLLKRKISWSSLIIFCVIIMVAPGVFHSSWPVGIAILFLINAIIFEELS